MNAFKFLGVILTLPVSLIILSSLQADESLSLLETSPLEEEIGAFSSLSSIGEIDQPLLINFKSLPTPSAEEESIDMPFSEAEMEPQSLENPVFFPSAGEEIVLSPKIPDKPLVQTTTTVAPTPRLESATPSSQIDMREVFQGAPLIYSILVAISIGTFALWLYTLLNMRTEKLMPHAVVATLQENLTAGKTKEALNACNNNSSLLSRMLHSGLLAYHANPSEMMENMQSEGKRISSSLWQKLGLLNDVAIVAPMIGLLGTVVGMFYAFYDINRSLESMNALFDGLGISVGTTVAGLILAILALVLHSTSKYRLVKQLTQVESTAHNLISRISITPQKEE